MVTLYHANHAQKKGYGGGPYLCFIAAICSFVACGLSAVIGMGMGDHRQRDRTPWIHVEATGFAPEAFSSRNEESVRGHGQS